ncbi:MAG: hypothetical protein HYU66_10095 [Armatimonadetes bacterium]|nr:hypothetical protein [Armatimonadota bacterium]
MIADRESGLAPTAAIPGFEEPFSLALSPPVQALRDRALLLHRGPQGGIPELRLADARAWSEHTADEDWLLWRARWSAERLRSLPLDLEPGEKLIGKPRYRADAPEDAPALEGAGRTLADLPPFPGGDAGHFHPDHEKLLRLGVSGMLAEIDRLAARQGLTPEQATFYRACRTAMQGFQAFVHRAAGECRGMAERDQDDAARWLELAAICERVATEPPATLHEAMQLQFLAIIALWFAEDHGLTCPDRLDQLMRSFYEADLAAGRTTPREAFELIACLYIQLNRILWPGSAVAVMVGGRDPSGADVTNDLTYLCLAARQATRLCYPTVGLAWHAETPDELADYSVRMLATGVGCPAFFNEELIAEGLRRHGVRREDSYNFMNSTCVEIKVVGASHMWVTAPYFNLPKALLDVMGEVAAGARPQPASYDALLAAVEDNLAGTIRGAAQGLDACWRQRAVTGCFPLASCFIADCLERGVDFDRGGARYNWVENSFVGLANLTDGLEAVRHLVYDRGELSLAGLHDILRANWEGHEALRQRILNTLPHYGNDDEAADGTAKALAEYLIETTESNTIGPHCYVPGFFCWIIHEHFGSRTGATPDGRFAGLALADGAGGAQGRERRGPTAAVLSSTKWSHVEVLGGLVHNLKFAGSVLRSDRDRPAARRVIETFLQRGGFEIQVNVVSRETLLDAQAHPEQYQDLLVRVAGYSDYFVHLNPNMQAEVIARTEHEV